MTKIDEHWQLPRRHFYKIEINLSNRPPLDVLQEWPVSWDRHEKAAPRLTPFRRLRPRARIRPVGWRLGAGAARRLGRMARRSRERPGSRTAACREQGDV